MNPRHIRIGKEGYTALAKEDMTVARLVLEKALTAIRDPERGWLHGAWGEASGPGCLNTRLIATMDTAQVPLSGSLGAELFFQVHPQVKFLFERALRGVGRDKALEDATLEDEVDEVWEDMVREESSIISRIIQWNDSMERTVKDIELLLINLIRICRKVERNQVTERIARYSSVEEDPAQLQYVYVFRTDA